MKHYLISGGAGFIGSNYVQRLLARGEQVVILDNLSRVGAAANLGWLQDQFGKDAFAFIQGDVTDAELCNKAAAGAEIIVHLAGQVAVTTSIKNPRLDFEYNALGTFNMLEAARSSGKNPAFLYASTNKVYGGMEEVHIMEEETRYDYADYPYGIPESHPVDFHSPYGCSKGCGDQYVRDYTRIYELPTVVLRQSCIYGPRQFGIEDQGWLAWFIIAALQGHSINIYGNGKQVRDVLYIDDLLDAYDLALDNLDAARGQIFNIGGGRGNTLSVWKEFSLLLEELLGRPVPCNYNAWRAGDQPVYISDIRKAEQILGWKPKIKVQEGIRRLYRWIEENISSFPQR